MARKMRLKASTEQKALEKAKDRLSDDETPRVVDSYESVALGPDRESATTWVIEVE